MLESISEPSQNLLQGASERQILLDTARELYRAHGIQGISTPFLEKQRGRLYHRLLAAGLYQPALLRELGLSEEYAAWKASFRTYRGVAKPRWSWETAVTKAKELLETHGDLPTVEWCRKNGLTPMVNAVFKAGKTWDDLRREVGARPASTFHESRNGVRWRSRPEASLSNFLYARGIEHQRGERYPESYCKQFGRQWGQFDLHFRAATGEYIDVEVWGDELNNLAGGRYKRTRADKEKWHENNPNFLGIPYKDCLSDAKLTEILGPYIGVIEPFKFDQPRDRIVETSHWSDADDLLKTCREFAADMPDGIFPSESWLRKRGKHKNRPGEPYNTLAVRVNQWLGGTRNVRKLLGQGEASTTEWSEEKALKAWQDFEQKHGLTPSQCKGKNRRTELSPEIYAEASRIYRAVVDYGVLDTARCGKSARKTTWTREATIMAYHEFTERHGRTPSQCMSKMRRATLPKDVTDEATRIYNAAQRLNLLRELRDLAPHIENGDERL